MQLWRTIHSSFKLATSVWFLFTWTVISSGIFFCFFVFPWSRSIYPPSNHRNTAEKFVAYSKWTCISVSCKKLKGDLRNRSCLNTHHSTGLTMATYLLAVVLTFIHWQLPPTFLLQFAVFTSAMLHQWPASMFQNSETGVLRTHYVKSTEAEHAKNRVALYPVFFLKVCTDRQ